jgi:hypothetical protein
MGNDDQYIYEKFREEIKREDEITHNRLVTSLTFQGFLMGATGFLLSGLWPDTHPCIFAFREWVVGGIGLIGFFVASSSAIGIQAARMSIGDTKTLFKALKDGHVEIKVRGVKGVTKIMLRHRLELDPRLPKIHGRSAAFGMGYFYAWSLPFVFSLLWAIYICCYTYYLKNYAFGYVVCTIAVLFTTLHVWIWLLNLEGKKDMAKKISGWYVSD